MITNRQQVAALIVACATGILVPSGLALGPDAAAATQPLNAVSVLPSAARAPIMAALTHDGVAQADPTLTQASLIPNRGAAEDNFGLAVAVSGTTVVVGSAFEAVGSNAEQGVAYVFTRPATGWKNAYQSAALTVSNGNPKDRFGYSVAIQGPTILVGAVEAKVGVNLGQGAVYVYTRPSGGWRTTSHPTARLTDDDGSAYDEIGNSVAISGDTIVTGAPLKTVGGDTFQGEVFVFDKPASGGWQTTASPSADLTQFGGEAFYRFGEDIAISGNTIVVGTVGDSGASDEPDAGAAYVFVRSGSTWTDARQLVGAGDKDDYFGGSVAIDGDVAVVGADSAAVGDIPTAGSAYVFIKPADGWGNLLEDPPLAATAVLTAKDAATNDEFGDAVAMSGKTVLVGAAGHEDGTNEGQGAAYLFNEPAAGWSSETQSSELVAKTGQAADEFGIAVAMDPTEISVGADGRDSGAGTSYVFAPAPPTMSKPKQSHKLWQLGGRAPQVNPSHRPAGGTAFSFSLGEAARVSMSFSEKVGKRIVKKGTLRFDGRSGPNRVFIDGRIGPHKKLVAGRCAVTISASTAYGETRPRTLKFTTIKTKRSKH